MNEDLLNQIKDTIMNETIKLKFDFSQENIPQIFKEGGMYQFIKLNKIQADVLNYIFYLTNNKAYTPEIPILIRQKLFDKFSLNDENCLVNDMSDRNKIRLEIKLPSIFDNITIVISN